MSRQTKKPKAPAAKSSPSKSRKRVLDSELDEGLEETFPASDPVSVSEPAAELPAGGGKK